MELEIIRHQATKSPSRGKLPPLLFVHGSYCGAWVWQENFMPYFAEKGFSSVAFSLRGHGNSPGHKDLDRAGLADFVDDLKSVVNTLDEPPILIGHSMGGMVVQKFLEKAATPAAVLLAPVSPNGLMTSMMHMAIRAPFVLWQINLMQMLGPQGIASEMMARELFSPEMPRQKLEKYLPLIQQESARVAVDLMATDFPWSTKKPFPPALVIGGDHDLFIPTSDLSKTARTYNADLQILPKVNHMLMLDTCWRDVADRMNDWIHARFSQPDLSGRSLETVSSSEAT